NVTAPNFLGTATRVSNSAIITLNGGTTEGTNKITFNGEHAKTLNITANSIGAPTLTGTGASGTWDISISGNAATATTASKVSTSVPVDTVYGLVNATMATNDYFRIAVGGATNAGYGEIATGDDANEPIYVRQYSGFFTSIVRSATLLDGSGNTLFPGVVTSKGFVNSDSSNSYVLLGGGGTKAFTSAATPSTIMERDSSGDVNCRLVRSNFDNQSTMSGGLVFRVNNSSDNYFRICSSPAAIREWLGVQDSNHTHDMLFAKDFRTVKPNSTGISSGILGIRPFFTSTSTLGISNYGDYADLLVLDTYGDSSGGNPNAIAFMKNTSNCEMFIGTSAFNGSSWGTFNRVWHNGISGTTAYDWSAKSLTLAGSITGATSINNSGSLDINSTGDIRLRAGAKSLILNATYLKPYDVDTNTISLGSSGGRWSTVYSKHINIDGDISGVNHLRLNTNAVISGAAHNLYFGGLNNYAHTSYFFRPHWGSAGVTESTLQLQSANTSGNMTTRVYMRASEGDSYIQTNRFISTVGNGTAPFSVSSSTLVSSLNADLLDDLHVHTGRNNEANKIVRTDSNGYIQAGYINSSSGNENNNASPDRVWGSNSSDGYLRTYRTSALSVDNSAKLGGIEAAHLKPKVSMRDFTNGTLIKTSIDYANTSGAAWLLKIHGNIYGNGTSLHLQAQGYIWDNSIINTNAIYYGTFETGATNKLIALNIGGVLCFWFGRQGYWAGYNVECYDVSGSTTYENLVTSIENVADPGGTKRVEIPLRKIYHSADNNIGNGATNYAAGNHTHTNYAGIVTTSGSGNAITAISLSGNTITATKGTTFLTTDGGHISSGKLSFSSVPNTETTNPTMLAYGKLTSYSHLQILGNTDATSGDIEYVQIAAAIGNPSPSDNVGLIVANTYAKANMRFEATSLGVTNSDSTTGRGVSLYGGAQTGMPSYGFMFAGTGTFSTHGSVNGDWATYLTMSGATSRGWIFRRDATNVASISASGIFSGASFNGITGLAGNGSATTVSRSDHSHDYLPMSKTLGGDDAYRWLFDETTNSGKLILELIDDMDGSEQFIVRGRKTYAPLNSVDILTAKSNGVLLTGGHQVWHAGNLAFGGGESNMSRGNHTHTFASLTSKPTTLAGYGITDAAASGHTHAYSPYVSSSITIGGDGSTFYCVAIQMNASLTSEFHIYKHVHNPADWDGWFYATYKLKNREWGGSNEIFECLYHNYTTKNFLAAASTTSNNGSYGLFWLRGGNRTYHFRHVGATTLPTLYLSGGTLENTNVNPITTGNVAQTTHFWNSGNLAFGNGESNMSRGNHTHSYLPLSGGTLSGAISFANVTWNPMGDDAAIGDSNVAGMICIKSLNSAIPGIAFYNNSGTQIGQLKSNNGTLQWGTTNVSLSGHVHNMNEISDAPAVAIASGTVTRKIFMCTNKTGEGYISRAAIGLTNPRIAFSPVILSVGLNDAGTSWRDYTFDTNGNLSIDSVLYSSGTHSTSNGKYISIRCENSSHCHYNTDATQSHYFNKQVEVNGNIKVYGYNTYLSATGVHKHDSNNSYMLLGGGGHKLLSDFWEKTALNTTSIDFSCRNLTVAGSISQTSSEKFKTNIIKYTDSALELIDKVDVVKFHYKNNLEDCRIGFIAENTPEELSTKDKNIMDIGSNVGVLLKAVQELHKKCNTYEQFITNMVSKSAHNNQNDTNIKMCDSDKIPDGWVVCNGENNTIDLSKSFVGNTVFITKL
ncbi:MAG: tail fiber domain-containing protein, partial [Bacteroidales bacterium]